MDEPVPPRRKAALVGELACSRCSSGDPTNVLNVWHRLCSALCMLEIGLTFLGLFAVGLTFGLYAASRAPVGYEDATGFHFGPETQDHAEEIAVAIPEFSR